MPTNIEVKARVDDVEELKRLAQHLSGAEPTVLPQEDVFFNAPNGRLKLRRLQVLRPLLLIRRSHQARSVTSATIDQSQLIVTLFWYLKLRYETLRVHAIR